MRVYGIMFGFAVILWLGGCAREEGTAPERAMSPGEQYITSVIACLEHSRDIIGDMIPAADDAARRLADGGNIYVTDDETIFRTGGESTKIVSGGGYNYPMHEDWGGFVAEACDRAGGLRHIQPVPVGSELTSRDVVLAGTLDLDPGSQVELLEKLRGKGTLVILFGSRQSRVASAADYLIDNGLEAGTVPVMDVGTGQRLGPVAGAANVVNMWTFTAELVSALTRQGKMPTLWQSMFVPGAAPRNERIGEYMFHPDMRIMPIEKGVLGREYLSAVAAFLDSIKTNELEQVRRAGDLCAETISGGGTVVASLIGHFMVSQTRMPGYPPIFTVRANEYGIGQLEGILDDGDVWLHVGYSYYPVRELTYARAVGAKTVCVFTAGPAELGEGEPVATDMSLVDVYINPYWKHGDAVVEVPDYDVRIIPPSGIVMITCWWMLIGETASHLPPGRL